MSKEKQITIENIISIIKDPKIYIEIIEKISGASFSFYNKNNIPIDLLNKKIEEINVQYRENKRLLIIEF